MNILITGINGFIGGELNRFLSSSNNVYGVINKKGPTSKNIFKVDLTSKKEIDYFLGNELKNIKIDIIIHTAFILSNKEDDFIKNSQITFNMVKIINHLNPKKILNFSTIRVYENKDSFFSEKSKTVVFNNEDCLYGLAKKCSEQILKNVCSPSIRVISLRIAQVYDSNFESNKLLNSFKSQLLEKNEIEIWGKGRRGSCFISLEKLCYYISIIIEHEFDKNIEINIGEENILYREFAKRIIKKYGNRTSKINIINKGISSNVKINFSRLKKIIDGKS